MKKGTGVRYQIKPGHWEPAIFLETKGSKTKIYSQTFGLKEVHNAMVDFGALAKRKKKY